MHASRHRPYQALALLLAASLLPRGILAQESSHADTGAAVAYLARFRELEDLAPARDRVAHVSNLVLDRDAGRLVLEDGTLSLLSPVGGRLVGAVFQGRGRFTFAPPLATEREALRRFADSTTLDAPFHEVVLLFTDATAEQLHALAFGPGDLPGSVGDHAHDLIASLQGRREDAFDPDVLEPLLNGERSGLFLARVARDHGDALLFEIDPAETEAVKLLRPVNRARWGAPWTVVSEFPLRPDLGAVPRADRRQRLEVVHYAMDIGVVETFGADLAIDATAVLALRAKDDLGPWLHFGLDHRLHADSARWGVASAPVFKADDDETVWVRAPRRLAAGDSLALTLYYHGDMIDRYANFFLIDPTRAWYPINAEGYRAATFDLTFHSPARYALVSVGERSDSSLAGRVVTTHWLARRPTPYATFNVGLFRSYRMNEDGSFPVDVLYSDEAHRAMRQLAASQHVFLLEQSHKEQNVAADVSNALKLFTYLFGPCPFEHFYAAEIPYGEGVSFPGMIDFGYFTFNGATLDGFDDWFRAHETAHQWWGNGVFPGSYRDAWLSEGLASFAALWYLQVERKHSTEYFRFLDRYRADVEAGRAETGPIWLGARNITPQAPDAYETVVYEKGAWVFNMLRVLMLDLRTMSDSAFTATLRDYYWTYAGAAATTADFQRVVERHVGAPMDWFFDEWIKGTEVPTYHVAWKREAAPGGRFRVRLRVRQEGVPADFRMPVLVAADLGGGRIARFRVTVRGAQGEYESPLLPSEPRDVTFNDLHAVLASVKTETW
jgi:hypothetical protein